MLGKTEGKRVWQRIRWLDGIIGHDGITGHELEQTSRDSGGQRRPGMLQSMGSQRVRHDLVTEQVQRWQEIDTEPLRRL